MTKSLHPSLKNSLIALGERYFAGLILEDQDCFAVEQGWTTFLELLPHKEVAENLRNSGAARHPIQHPNGRILNSRLKVFQKKTPDVSGCSFLSRR